ncbi:hypothetical protein GCM10027072_74480 [Streptomyces bullii]
MPGSDHVADWSLTAARRGGDAQHQQAPHPSSALAAHPVPPSPSTLASTRAKAASKNTGEHASAATVYGILADDTDGELKSTKTVPMVPGLLAADLAAPPPGGRSSPFSVGRATRPPARSTPAAFSMSLVLAITLAIIPLLRSPTFRGLRP